MTKEQDQLLPAWAAGFFEGEGCVAIYKYRTSAANYSHYLKVCITNNNPWGLTILQQHWGGKIRQRQTKKKRARTFDWTLYNRRARQFLEDVRPHLIFKQEQVDIGIAFLNHFRPHQGCPMTAEETGYRESLRVRLEELNTRGKDKVARGLPLVCSS